MTLLELRNLCAFAGNKQLSDVDVIRLNYRGSEEPNLWVLLFAFAVPWHF